MKFSRALCVFILILACFGISEAKVRFGIRGSLAATNITGDSTVGWDWRLGKAIAGCVEFPITPLTTMEIDLQVAQRGATLNRYSEGDNGSLEERIVTVEIPIMFKLGPDRTTSIYPLFELGGVLSKPIFDRSQHRYTDYLYEPYDERSLVQEDVKVSSNDLRLSFSAGVGLMVPLSASSVQIDLRYLQEVTKHDSWRSKSHDEAVELSFAYFFGRTDR